MPAEFRGPSHAKTRQIIGAAMEVHTYLGPGLLESTYEACLADEMLRRGIRYQRQVHLPINYKGRILDDHLRLDFVIDDQVIVELKSVEKLIPIHEAQLITYLRLTGIEVGLLFNFNVASLRNGIVRRVLHNK